MVSNDSPGYTNHPDLWTQENGEWIYLRN
ncbi:DUF2686 family protein [Escherichia coli]